MYYKEQNKNLLSEIERIRQIMGLSLITEQYGWLDNLISAGAKRFVSLDDIISKLGFSGKILKDADIDKIVDELPEIIDDNAKNQIRNILKKDANLKASLENQNDDFLLKLRKSKDKENIGGFNKVDNITPEEVSSTVRRVINKFLDDPLSNVSKSFDNLDNAITSAIEKRLSDGTSKLRSADEIYDIADSLVQRNLKNAIEDGMSNQVANEIFNKFKTKFRTDSKLKTKLDELISSNRVSNLQKRTASIDNFNSKVEVPDDLIATSSWIDETPYTNKSKITKTLNDLNPKVKEKYNKILEKEKTGIVLTDYEKNLKSDVEKFLNGENINLKDYDFPKTYIDNLNNFIKKYIKYNKKYSQLIRDMVYSLDNTKYIESDIKNTFPQFENGILPEEIKKTITDDPNLKNFFTNLEGKKYGWQVDSEEKWIPTNMLDGNIGDKTTFLRDILEEVMNKEGKKIDEFMTFNEQEQNRLLNETLKHIENNKSILKNKLLESERYIKNSQRTIIRGDEGEEIAKNAFIKNNFEIVWQGGKGNALDKLGVDMIVKTDGKHYLVSVKTIPGEFRTYPSNITGKNLIGFFQPSKINIDTGFAAYVDKNNKLIVVPPQARFSKETGEKIGEGFRKDLGWTQIEDDSVLIKNF